MLYKIICGDKITLLTIICIVIANILCLVYLKFVDMIYEFLNITIGFRLKEDDARVSFYLNIDSVKTEEKIRVL